MGLTNRFIKYLRVDTESINGSKIVPSSVGQKDLVQILINELKTIDLDMVEYSNGVIYAFKKSDYSVPYKSLGLIAHIDTYPLNCKGVVEPIVIDDYKGAKDISHIKSFPLAVVEELNDCLHHRLVFSKYSSNLGADDKAGVAEIVTAMERIKTNNIKTPDIYIALTCDEEVGLGSRLIDFKKYNPDYSIVLDGEFAGEIHIDNMSVFSCAIRVRGREYYVGRAKDIAKNAIDIIYEFMNEFSTEKKPKDSENKEGFFNWGKIQGDSKNIILMCSAMSFEEEDINRRIQKIYDTCAKLNIKYGKGTISVRLPQGGYNCFCSNVNEEYVDIIRNAMHCNNLECKKIAFRGMTDSVYLREKGLHAITIGIGASSFHSIYEWASINDMEKTTNTIITLCSQKLDKNN